MKRSLFAVMLLATLAGCASQNWENRVACSADKQEAYTVSKYYRLGVASQIAKADALVICEGGKK